MLITSCTMPVNNHDKKLHIVTSFYPVYVTVLNITDGCSDIEVSNLTDTNTGCLHDYALTTSDLKKLSTCDALVINGAGMEPFMDKIRSNTPNLKVVDTSAGVQVIDNNPHIWLDFNNMYRQIDTITAELSILNPDNATKFSENATAYKEKLTELEEKMKENLSAFAGEKIVTFHEAFSYFAKQFNLIVATTIQHDEHSAPTPNEIAQTIELIRNEKIRAIFAEPGNSDNTIKTVSEASGVPIFTLDPIVKPQANVPDKDAYTSAMEQNLKTLKTALS